MFIIYHNIKNLFQKLLTVAKIREKLNIIYKWKKNYRFCPGKQNIARFGNKNKYIYFVFLSTYAIFCQKTEYSSFRK